MTSPTAAHRITLKHSAISGSRSPFSSTVTLQGTPGPGSSNTRSSTGTSSTYEGLSQLSRDELIQRVLQLQSSVRSLTAARNEEDQERLQQATNVRSSLGSPTNGSTSSLKLRSANSRRSSDAHLTINSAFLPSSAACRLSSSPPPPPPPPKQYDISMSVMVIDNGSVVVLPLSSVLEKGGKKDHEALEALLLQQPREADTPVVSSRFLGDSPSLDRFSVGSSYPQGNQFQQGHSNQQVQQTQNSLIQGMPALPLHPIKGIDDSMNFVEEDLQRMQSSAKAKWQAHNNYNVQEGVVDVEEGYTGRLSQHSHDRDEEDEPSPKRPTHYRDACNNDEHAVALSRGAGLPPHLLYESVAKRNLRPSASYRDISLDSDAMVTGNTLRTFYNRFHSNLGSGPVLSPVSSYATAIYHYIVKTFSVRNACQHNPNDVEGFGRTLMTLCGDVQRILKSEPRHGHMTSPCYVFGDLHGNFRDLFYFMDNLISFQDLRYTPHKFMFLGDYVDRGEFSVEVVAYLFAMKVIAPEKVLLLRGNHEDTLVSGDVSGYGSTSFRAQCHSLFGMGLGEEVWCRVSQVFMYLPLTANIDNVIFCTHGGIPRYDGNGKDDRMEQLMREDFPPMASFFEVPERESKDHAYLRQLAMDTCWADPADDESALDEYGFGDNPRGTGVILFGNTAVDTFLNRYGFQYIFRAHQEKADGLKLSKNARVFTIFSTSSYVGHQNGAGVVLVADGKIRLMVKNADLDIYEDEEEEQEELQEEEEGRDYYYEEQDSANVSPQRRRV